MLLRVNDLSVTFCGDGQRTPLTRGVSFSLAENECIGIVGESGSGKSITCSAINGLLGEHFAVQGEVVFKGDDLLALSADERRKLRGTAICMILQSPMTAFNPLFTIGNHVVETICAHRDVSSAEALDTMAGALARVKLDSARTIFAKYPHELSGGMLQRIMIALAIVMQPALLIADEPTTAIDYISQQEVIRELRNIREELDTSLVFISHDLSLVSHVADKVIVMNQGEVVERGKTQAVFCDPQHEYTRYLIENRRRVVTTFTQLMGASHVAQCA